MKFISLKNMKMPAVCQLGKVSCTAGLRMDKSFMASGPKPIYKKVLFQSRGQSKLTLRSNLASDHRSGKLDLPVIWQWNDVRPVETIKE